MGADCIGLRGFWGLITFLLLLLLNKVIILHQIQKNTITTQSSEWFETNTKVGWAAAMPLPPDSPRLNMPSPHTRVPFWQTQQVSFTIFILDAQSLACTNSSFSHRKGLLFTSMTITINIITISLIIRIIVCWMLCGLRRVFWWWLRWWLPRRPCIGNFECVSLL